MNRLWNIRHAQQHPTPPKWVPILGELQKTLQKGEYLPLRPLPMFESNFVQVTNRGGPVFVHHRANRLTMGVAASLPGLMLPDILLIAQPTEGRDSSGLVLTRMIPLDLVHLYIHDLSSWRLKLRLVTGRCYYLELDAPDHEVGFLFNRWIRLINLLREPATTWAPRTLHTPPLDMSLATAPASTWHLQEQAHLRRAAVSPVTIPEPTFPYKMLASQKKKKKPKALKRRFKSQAVGDSVPLIWSQLEQAGYKSGASEKSHPDAHSDKSNIQTHASGKASITIRTIFSIISNTINQSQSSKASYTPGDPGSEGEGLGVDPQPGTSESDEATGKGGVIKNPTRCISNESPDLTFLGSYDHLETLLWKQDIEELMDPESSTLSSSSLGPPPYPPPKYLFPARISCPGSHDKAQSTAPRQGPGPPLPQKTAVAPTTTLKAPFIVDQSQKVPAVPAPSRKAPAPRAPIRKAPARGGPSQKMPPASTVPRKTPAMPYPPQKPPALYFPPQKTLPSSQQALPVSAVPPHPHTESPLPLAPSQKAPASLPQYQMAVGSSTLQEKAIAKPEMLPVGIRGGDVLERVRSEEKPKPMVLLAAQEINKVEMRTQITALELPFTTAKKEAEDILVSKTRELTLDGLKGRGKLEDRAYKAKEEVTLDLPGMKSKEVEHQKTWIKTKEMAIEGPLQDQSRPFSVEGLALAKLMIIANSKEKHLRLPSVSLPSWLSVASGTSTVSTKAPLPFTPSQVTFLDRPPVIVKEQPESHTWVKENMQERWTEKEPSWDTVGTSKATFPSVPTTASAKMVTDPEVPIPLPPSRWEELSQQQPPMEAVPISRSRGSVRIRSSARSRGSVRTRGSLRTPGSTRTRDSLGSTRTRDLPGSTRTWDSPGSTRTHDLPGSTRTWDLPGSTRTQDLPGSIRTGDSLGSASTQDLPASIMTQDLPASIRTQDLPASIRTQDLPASIRTGDSPGSARTRDLPGSTRTRDSPGSIRTRDLPASIRTQDLPASIRTGDSPGSARTRDSPGSIRTRDLPASIRTQDLPGSIRTQDLPASIRTQDLPPSIRTQDLPASIMTRDLPASIRTGDSPGSIRTRDSPGSIRTRDLPASIRTQDLPASIRTQDLPASIRTGDSPGSIRTQDLPASIRTQDLPASIRTQDLPASIRTQDLPASIRTGDSPGSIRTQDLPASIRTGDSPGSIRTQDLSASIRTRDLPGSIRTRDAPGSARTQDLPGSVRMPQLSRRTSQEPERMLSQHPLAKAGLSSEILLPVLLDVDSRRDTVTKAEMTEKQDAVHPVPSTPSSQHSE